MNIPILVWEANRTALMVVKGKPQGIFGYAVLKFQVSITLNLNSILDKNRL